MRVNAFNNRNECQPGFVRGVAPSVFVSVAIFRGRDIGLARQRGQVIPFTLVFISAVILSGWVMYDSGQVQTEKIKLQNTADNVAYSSAALISRDLNFSAYTNRAMVANQVGNAQMVGLSSYTTFLKQTATNVDAIANALQIIPGFGQAFKAASTALKQGASALSSATDQLAGTVIPADDGIIRGLSRAQKLYHTTALGDVGGFSQNLGHLNDPDAVSLFKIGNAGSLVSAATALAQWQHKIGSQNRLHDVSANSGTAQAENARFRQFGRIVYDSRDPFSRKRSYKWGFPFKGGIGLGPEIETRKYGGTELHRAATNGEYHWDWAAMDTAGLYTRVCVPIFGCSSWAGDFPVGWGAAHAVNPHHGGGGDAHFSYDETPRIYAGEDRDDAWGHAWHNNLAATIDAGTNGYHKISQLETFQHFYAFRNDKTNHDYGPTTMAVYLKSENDISSEHKIIEDNGGTVAPDLDTQSAGGLLNHRISAAAKARPYFARATDLESFARHDRHYEHGNLFNPFWEPQLVELSAAEKTSVTAAVAALD